MTVVVYFNYFYSLACSVVSPLSHSLVIFLIEAQPQPQPDAPQPHRTSTSSSLNLTHLNLIKADAPEPHRS